MDRIVFRELPGIADIERQYLLYLENRLMRPEIQALAQAIDEKCVELFGIRWPHTSYWDVPEKARTGTPEEWERHFQFIEEDYEEESAFWDAFGIDVSDGEGEQLACLAEFARPLVCALKRLHPDAVLTVRRGQTEDEVEAAAEAWGRRLLAGKR